MEITQEQAPALRPFKQDNEDAESEMGVKLTPQLYKMLSSGIYQNNVRAILREYLCNAYDAQVEAGRPEAEIQLFLPNAIEPNFKIRDYGTGLSEEGMRKVFGAYGNSTKTSTNAQIGCFGIGSKSAFSYTDHFSVVSYYKDTKRMFSCFLENGMPKIRLMTEEDTDEPNGLEVSFPVMEPVDFQRFQSEAMFVLKPFKDKGVNFKVFGSRQTEVTDYKHEVDGDGWFLSRDIRGGLTVRMGLVDYVVDIHQLNLSTNLRTVAKHGILLRMPMGSVQPTPSRENLQIDEATKKALNEAIDPISKELLQKFMDQINNASSMQEARKLYSTLALDYRGPFYDFRDSIRPMWRGRKVFMKMEPANYGFEVIKITKHQRYSPDKAIVHVGIMVTIDMLQHIDDIKTKLVWEDYPNGEFRVRTYLINFGSPNQALYLVRPTKSYIQVPIYNKRKLESMRKRGLISKSQTTTLEYRTPTMKDMKRFFEALGVGWKAFRMASSFPKKERAKPQRRMTGPDPKAKAFTLKDNPSSTKAEAWTEAELDIKAGGYYIPIRHWKCSLPCNVHLEGEERNQHIEPQTLRELVVAASTILQKPIVLYGINKEAVLLRMQKEGNWHNIWDCLVQAYWTFQDDNSYKLHEYVRYAQQSSSVVRLITVLMTPRNEVLNHIPGTHKGPIVDAVLRWDTLLEESTKNIKYGEYARSGIIPYLTRFMERCLWQRQQEKLSPELIMEKLGIPDLYKEYPLLAYINTSQGTFDSQQTRDVANYLLQCDKLRYVCV